MKLKIIEINGKKYAEVDEAGEKPIYIHDDGKPLAFDAPATVATISRLNTENQGVRERAEGSEARLKAFEGIADPAAAVAALEKVKNIKDGDLISAGKAEEIKNQARKAAEETVAAAAKANADALSAVTSERDKISGQLHKVMIGGSFARSKLVTGDEKTPVRLAIPADLAEAYFGKHFKVEGEKIIATDANGGKIFSRARPGEVAEFDEALELLVQACSFRDQIVRGTGHTGDGKPNNSSNNGSGKKTIKREDYNKLDPMAKRNASFGKDAMQIVD